MTKQTKEKSPLEKAVLAIPRGKVFSCRDLQVQINDATLRQGLKRLVDKGIIRRAQRGYFERPVYSKFLQENLGTDMVKMAHSIARNNKWTIAPSGNTALNMLGLSTQVPAKWTFVSDGPYKKYNINGIQLEFKHRANRNISGMSPKTLLVIHALKSLTAEQTTPEVLDKIKSRLTLSEKKKLLEEAIYISSRNLHSIRKICEDACTPWQNKMKRIARNFSKAL